MPDHAPDPIGTNSNPTLPQLQAEMQQLLKFAPTLAPLVNPDGTMTNFLTPLQASQLIRGQSGIQAYLGYRVCVDLAKAIQTMINNV